MITQTRIKLIAALKKAANLPQEKVLAKKNCWDFLSPAAGGTNGI